jgi:hypothetical protein
MDPKACRKCGTPTDAEYAGGLCPACLLKDGLQAVPRLRCHACHDTLADDMRFCGHCGAPVPAEPAAQGDSVRAALEAKLQSQYRIVRLLGRGGMGSVYLARDLTLDREVAIKVVKTDSSAREIQDRLRREARTAARLSHPNVVPLYTFGDVDGMPYFVMGYVRGESLAARLRRDGKMLEDEARRILADLAEALDHAHRQGVVHRDVKPDNVLLDDESGRALLTDFGVAKALGGGETMTSAGSVVGTPSYMSPEQAAGRADIDGRSDIYSLGVMGYAMLSGRLPFDGKTAGDVLAKHLTQEPPPLRVLAPALSDSTVQAVERCLAKDPAKRWPDARSLKVVFGTVEEEGALPDALRAVEGKGVAGLATVLGFYGFLAWLFYFAMHGRGDIFGNAFFGVEGPGHLMFPASFVGGYFVLLLSLRRQGYSFARSQAVIWREPSWWSAWYPRALRRPGNVWDRLPTSARAVRSFVTATAAFLWVHTVVAMVLSVYIRRHDVNERELPYFDLFVTVELVMVIAMLFVGLVLRMRAVGEMKRKGLGEADANRVAISVPPGRASFWARPHIAAVLAPAANDEAVRRTDSPHEQLQSVLRNADGLSGPLRTLGTQAAVAARQLLVSIEHADREIAELARSLDPGEEERLAAKIDALGGVSAAGDVRPLLEKQLALVRELSTRIEEGRAERIRRVEMLKTLALHLASLRARASEAPAEVPSLSERVRQLCDEIGGQASALAEARAAAGRASTEAPTRARATPENRG